MRSIAGAVATMAVLVGIDQAVKVWVRLNVPLFHSTELVPHLLELTHVENRGVSFSFLGGLSDGVRVPLLVGISLAAIALLAYYWLRHREELNALANWAFILILPGAVGNLIDRVLLGTVTDFLHFRIYRHSLFVNNLADILISLGVLAYLAGVVMARRQRAPDSGS